MASPYSREGRDYYATPEGKIVSVDTGFDTATQYPNLVPATKDQVDGNDYARAQQRMTGPSLRDDGGNFSGDAVFGASTLSPVVDTLGIPPEVVDAAQTNEAAAVEQFNELPPYEPEAPKAFNRDGRDFYVDGHGKVVSVDAGFDPSEEYPDLTPATGEQVHARDIQKRSGGFLQQLETVPATARATIATARSGLEKFGALVDPFRTRRRPDTVAPEDEAKVLASLRRHAEEWRTGETDEQLKARADAWIRRRRQQSRGGYASPEELDPAVFTPEQKELREANPTAAFLGAALPDVYAAFSIPEAGPAAKAAQIIASSIITEAGDAVIEGHEFDMGTALGVWAPTQLAFEVGGNAALKGAAKALGWSRNAVNVAVQRARASAVQDALRETDPVKQAAKLVKEAPHIYEKAQTGLDEALGAIDERMTSAPEKLFTKSALKRSVSNNITAQSDTLLELATQAAHAAEVTGAPTLERVAQTLGNVRGSGGAVLYNALREARQLLVEAAEAGGERSWASYASDNPLTKEVVESIDKALVNENVWGRAARDHASVLAEAARGGAAVKHAVRDVAGRDAITQRIEQARRVASLTKDEKLAKAAERAKEALDTADKVTGARLMNAKASPDEIEAMRKSLNAFPERASKIAATVAKGLETLDEAASALLPDTWTAERIERHIAERAAGSKAARKELDTALDGAEKWAAGAKRAGTHKATTIARVESQLQKLRDALDEVDQVAKAAKTVRDFDAMPRNRVEKVINAVTGKAASAITSRMTSTVAGAAAGYAGGGPIGGVIGGAVGEVANQFVEPAIRERAGKFGAWLKESLRKNGVKAGAVAALYGADQLATNESDPSPAAAANIALLAIPLLLTRTGIKLRKGELPARGLLDAANHSLAGRITAEHTLKDVDRAVQEIYEGWQHGFTRNQGRAPTEREKAVARNALAISGWHQHGELRRAAKASGTAAPKPEPTVAAPAADAVPSPRAARVAEFEPAVSHRQLGDELQAALDKSALGVNDRLSLDRAFTASEEERRAALAAYVGGEGQLSRDQLLETQRTLIRSRIRPAYLADAHNVGAIIDAEIARTNAAEALNQSDGVASRLRGALDQSVDEMSASDFLPVNERNLNMYVSNYLGQDFTPHEQRRIGELIAEHIEELTARGSTATRLRGEAQAAVRRLTKAGRSISLESILADVGTHVKLTEPEAMQLERVIETVGDELLEKATRLRGKRERAAARAPVAIPELQPGDMPGNAHQLLTKEQGYITHHVGSNTSDRELQRYHGTALEQWRSRYFEDMRQRPNPREEAFASAILDTTGRAHRDEARARTQRTLGLLQGANPARQPPPEFTRRQQGLRQGNSDELLQQSHAAVMRLPAEDRAWLRIAYDELESPQNVVTGYIRTGRNLMGGEMAPRDVVDEQIQALRIHRGRYTARLRGQRAPLPGTPEWGQLNRLEPEMEAAARAEFTRRNHEWAEEVQPPAPEPAARASAGRTVTRGRDDVMREVTPDEISEWSTRFDNNEAGPNPTVEAVDAVIERLRKEHPITPAEEVYLRDQLGQTADDWSDAIRDGARRQGEYYSGERRDIGDVDADDVIRMIENGETRLNNVDLTPWDEYHIRQEFELNRRDYQDTYRESATDSVRQSDDENGIDSDAEQYDSYRPGSGQRGASADGLPDHEDLRDIGIEAVYVRDQNGIGNVFGQDLTTDDLRELFGLDQLKAYADDIGKALDASLTVNNGSVEFAGSVGKFQIDRKITPMSNGKGFKVYNKYFKIPEDLQAGAGEVSVGKQVLQGMAAANERLGGKEMSLSAAWVGRYLWPSLGFRPSREAEQSAFREFRSQLERWGIAPDHIEDIVGDLDTLRDLADVSIPRSAIDPRLRDLDGQWERFLSNHQDDIKYQPLEKALFRKPRDVNSEGTFSAGKAFLLMRSGTWNSDLRIRIDGGEWWKEYKRRIGVAALLGFTSHEILQALSESPTTVWTADSPWQEAANDNDEAGRILSDARTQVDAINEEREQTLDATRDKLSYLSHQGRTLMQSAARTLAGSTANDNHRVERIPGVTANAGVARFLGSNSNLAEAFEDKRRTLEELKRDPMALVEELSESFAELQDTAPELHSQVVAQTFKIANYLQAKVPVAAGASLVRPEGAQINSLAVRQFALYYSAATDPASVITDLANNRARKEQVDTLRDVWPDTYQQLKLSVLERMSEKRPTVDQRIRLDLLFDFGAQFDRALSPALVAAHKAYRDASGAGGANGNAAAPVTPERRSQGSIKSTGALNTLALGPAAGPGAAA